MAGVVATVAGLAIGLPAGAAVRTAPPSAEVRESVHGLRVSAAGRRRVRGGRAEAASIHDAWMAGSRHVDEAGAEALAAFERASFVPGAGVVAVAPKPWMKALTRSTLPLRWTRRLVEYLEYFKTNPKGRLLMRGWLRRAGRYETKLRAVLAECGVPEDLVFVALAESGFNPTVRSRVGAAGLWQFMDATGEVYGLNQDYWVDERHDIVKSTRAAGLYLKDLHTRFGTWELALAAFNAGYGLMMVSIDRHNTNDYWALADLESGMPFATTNYVPKILAAALVGTNRDALGYDDDAVAPLPAIEWAEVRVPGKTSLAAVADQLGVSETLLAELNAQYIRGRTPPGHASTIRIPRTAAPRFEKIAGSLPGEVAALTEYTVRHGERLAAIARAHGVPERLMRRVNRVRDSAELVGGTVVVIPPPPPDAEVVDAPAEPLPLAAVPALPVAPGHERVFFRTNRASLPRDVARAFGVSWAQIVAWNELDPRARLQSGQVLQVQVPAGFASDAVAVLREPDVELVVRGSRAHLEAGLSRRGLERRGYKVRKGDTLTRIGKRFGLSVGDLARINGFSRAHAPAVGELLVVYVRRAKRSATMRAPDPIGPPTRTPSTAPTARVPGRDGSR